MLIQYLNTCQKSSSVSIFTFTYSDCFLTISAITLHGLVRLIPLLNQLREGLQLYGLDEVLRHHHQMCQQLFVPGLIQEVSNMN